MATAKLQKGKAATKVKDSGSKTKESEVGKKLSAKDVTPKWEKGTLRYAFCIRFRELAGDRSPEELGQIIGCSHDLVRKWLRGIRTPEIDTLPRVAKAFGLKHWIELFEPTKKK